jgi:hypothetical protein
VDIVVQRFAQVGDSLINRIVRVSAAVPDRVQQFIRTKYLSGSTGQANQHAHHPGFERDDLIAVRQTIEVRLNEPGAYSKILIRVALRHNG